MAGYPPGSGYPPYGAPPNAPPYGAQPNPYGAAPGPYGAAPAQPYGEKPKKDKYGQGAASGDPYAAQSHGYGSAPPYGAPSHGGPPYGEKPPKDKYGAGDGYGSAPPYGAPSHGGQPYGEKPPKDQYGAGPPGGYGGAPYGAAPGGYGDPFAALKPSVFPPGTDPGLVASFQAADRDRSGFIDDKELQTALSSYSQTFSMRTVHLLMYLFTGTNIRKIGPKEFASVYYSLQNWRAIFERFDRDRSGRIDMNELREALMSLGFSVSPIVLDLLVSKFDKSGGKLKSIEYDNFIECCLTVKGLTEKFKEKDLAFSGSATFTYDAFMLTVLPFLIA